MTEKTIQKPEKDPKDAALEKLHVALYVARTMFNFLARGMPGHEQSNKLKGQKKGRKFANLIQQYAKSAINMINMAQMGQLTLEDLRNAQYQNQIETMRRTVREHGKK